MPKTLGVAENSNGSGKGKRNNRHTTPKGNMREMTMNVVFARCFPLLNLPEHVHQPASLDTLQNYQNTPYVWHARAWRLERLCFFASLRLTYLSADYYILPQWVCYH